jgi:hypothetical protein
MVRIFIKQQITATEHIRHLLDRGYERALTFDVPLVYPACTFH